jgi:hypothetical protein
MSVGHLLPHALCSSILRSTPFLRVQLPRENRIVSANLFAKSALLILLTASGTLAQEPTPLDKYERVRTGLSNSGYSTNEINAINAIAGQIYIVGHCPPEEGRDNSMIPYFIEVLSRGLTHSKDEIELRARELVPAMDDVLAADPAEKANVCGPTVEPQKNEPKR